MSEGAIYGAIFYVVFMAALIFIRSELDGHK